MYFDLPKKQMIAEAERRADEMAMNRNVESTKTDRPEQSNGKYPSPHLMFILRTRKSEQV